MAPEFAVFGASGAQGFPVLQHALASGAKVRAVSRSAQSADSIVARLSVETRSNCVFSSANFDEVDSLSHALASVNAAFVHLPIPNAPDEPPRFLGNLIAAAKSAQLPLLVFSTSGFAKPSLRSSPLIDGNRAASAAILECGVPAIVLQPTIYLENLQVVPFVPRLMSEGVLDYPPFNPNVAVPWTSLQDQAIVAVAAMKRPDLAGQAFEIASNAALNGPVLASQLSSALKRVAAYHAVTPYEFSARVAAAFNNPALTFLLGDMYEALGELRAEALAVDVASLEKTFGVKLGTVAARLDEIFAQ